MSAMRILSIMREDFPTLAPTTPIRRAAALLVEARASAAPVLGEDGVLAGILSQKDCFRPALHASYYREWTGSVADHMTREVVLVDMRDELIKVAEMFLHHRHRAFPVRDGGRIVGIVRRSDVLASLLSLG
ncbi:CBS domain-containing protein [Citreimonas salinaria]|uniref:CBS domain-containing protein n=1 Tax=Citreimonas salinaria TaxID=321339 RepID=A0A1H3L2E1_9RHOB|nr:CBS domain-containing protein [Citreimonas salinaria]SDY58118.1 CBS domain-containing protein [Citreimonas salinaria]